MSIARLKITLTDVLPAVVRRIEVPLAMPLADLHLVIQAVMPWWNYHLYEFQAKRHRYGVPDAEADWHGPSLVVPAAESTLTDLLAAAGGTPVKYLYDFGDDWEHTIVVEQIGDPEPGLAYPRLVEASGRCPPEDVGGPWGYETYLEAIGDPAHEAHRDMVAWRGPGFDPSVVDMPEIEKRLARLRAKFAVKAGTAHPGQRTLRSIVWHWSRTG